MGGIIQGINGSVSDALKAVGDVAGGKPPKASEVLPKELLGLADIVKDAQGDASAALKSLSGVSKELDDLEKATNKVKLSIDKATKAVEGANFGLDPKKPDDKKAIAAAKKKLSAGLDKALAEIDAKTKAFADLNKQVASAGKGNTLA